MSTSDGSDADDDGSDDDDDDERGPRKFVSIFD